MRIEIIRYWQYIFFFTILWRKKKLGFKKKIFKNRKNPRQKLEKIINRYKKNDQSKIFLDRGLVF